MVGKELSSFGRDGNEASSRVGPAGRGSMSHRSFSVHCNPERGVGTWAGLSSLLPLGKWSEFLRAVLEQRVRHGDRKSDGFMVMVGCMCAGWIRRVVIRSFSLCRF